MVILYRRLESSLLVATDEILRVDDVIVRDEVVRETGDADDLVEDCCCSAVDRL